MGPVSESRSPSQVATIEVEAKVQGVTWIKVEAAETEKAANWYILETRKLM